MTKAAEQDPLVGLDPEVAAFCRSLLDRAAAVRLPELFGNQPVDSLYWVGNRQGVTTLALQTSVLDEGQLVAIMTFRLAQYLMANQLDPRLIFARRLEHEPISGVTSEDIHVISGDARTGEILAYGTFKAVGGTNPNATMRDVDRPLFPVEEVFGRGLFNRLRVLPDLPVIRVREAGRLMKNHQHKAPAELLVRAPFEAMLGGFRLISGPLGNEVEACIGDVELGVAKKNQDLLWLPTVVLRGVMPYAATDSFGFHNYQYRTRYPYALLAADISHSRLAAIDAALSLPGAEGIAACLALKKDARSGRSSLAPLDGLTALNDTALPQEGVPMAVRRKLLDVGEWLRTTVLLHDLSVAEATVLGTMLERRDADPGAVVLRGDEAGGDLFLIEHGKVEVKFMAPDGRYLTARELGPREYFGETALIADGRRTAEVLAIEPLTLLKISRETYERFLSRIVAVEHDLTTTALARTHHTLKAYGSTGVTPE